MIHLMLHTHLTARAALTPDAEAVADRDRTLDYRTLDACARGTAAQLGAAGVVPGDRVVLFLDNSVAFVTAFWGALYAGATIVPVNPGTKDDKLGYILSDCTPAALLCDAAHHDRLAPICAATGTVPLTADTAVQLAANAFQPPADTALIDEDLGCIVYTSGSTGAPKGVMLTHRNLTAAARGVNGYLNYRASDRIFVAVPMTFDYGMHQISMAALAGACVIAETDFSRPLFSLDHAARQKATVFPIVPTMVPLICALADRFDFSALRMLTSTAAALPAGAIDRLQGLFPQATVFSMYGLTECHRCTYLPPDALTRRKGSVGIAIPGTQLWVIGADGARHDRDATGELVIRGGTVMRGYWNNPEATARRLKPGPLAGEQVLHTGDLVRLDAEGYVHFISRSDDILKIRGEKVAPKEVEDILLAHPAVLEAVVFGGRDRHGEPDVRAVVVPSPGQRLDPDMLRDWCAERADAIAVPRVITFQAEFARTQNGKIDRARITEELA